MVGMPAHNTIHTWQRIKPDFVRQYAWAREERAHVLGEEVLEIADRKAEGKKAVQRDRLRVEAQAENARLKRTADNVLLREATAALATMMNLGILVIR